jgi:hypothetical protein
MLTCFGMIWDMTNFQVETQDLEKYIHISPN